MNSKLIAPIAFASLLASAAIAGEHNESRDDFTGKVSRFYGPTESEFLSEKAVFQLKEYRRSDNTVFFVVAPATGSTDCDDKYLLLKTAEGAIHKIDAEEKSPKFCFKRIPADWIKSKFSVRIPMWMGGVQDATFDTTSLDLNRIAE